MSRPAIALSLALVLSGTLMAQGIDPERSLPVDPAFASAVEAGTRRVDGRPGEKLWAHEIGYDISLSLDPQTAVVSGVVRIEFLNGSPGSLEELRLHLRQNLHGKGAPARLEKTGGVELKEVVLLREGSVEPCETEVEGTVMRLGLGKPLAPGESVELRVAWQHKTPKYGSPRQGHVGDELFYLGYWYPQLAVHDDLRGWVAEQYVGAGEFYMPYADYRVEFTLPEGYVVRGTGKLLNPAEVLRPEQRKRLEEARLGNEVVAVIDEDDLEAGRITQDVDGDLLTWKFEAKSVRDFALAAGKSYVWDAVRADVPGAEEPCLVHAIYRPKYLGWHKAALAGKHAIEFGSRMKPYPWPHMSLCEGCSGGGMEYPMMTAIAAGDDPKRIGGTVIHEIIHMWFPMMAGSDEKTFAWMDEGMTSCLTGLAADELFGTDSGARREFEEYRLRYAGKDVEEPIMTHGDGFKTWAAYRIGAYRKPAAVFHQLRMMLGDEIFFGALSEYLEDWCCKHPRPEDLFATFERVSGKELDWYFKSFFHELDTVDYAIDSVTVSKGRTRLVIEKRGAAALPLEVRVTLQGGGETRLQLPHENWRLRPRLEFSLPGEAASVRLDPAQKLLDTNRKNDAWEN